MPRAGRCPPPGESRRSGRTALSAPGFLLLRPVLFGLAVAAAVIAGGETGSFWIGLLAFLIASGCGRTVRRALRRRPRAAQRALLWPAAATGFVVLFAELGLSGFAAAVLAFVCAGVTKSVLAALFLPRRPGFRAEDWGLPGMDDVIEGRWTEKREGSQAP